MNQYGTDNADLARHPCYSSFAHLRDFCFVMMGFDIHGILRIIWEPLDNEGIVNCPIPLVGDLFI